MLLAVLCCLASTKEAYGQSFTVIHNFNLTQGSQPRTGLAVDAAENFYGTTQYGGILNCDSGGVPGCGVAYKIRRVDSSWIFSVLYEFPGFDNNFLPTAPGDITIAPNGSPYGTQLFYPDDSTQSIYNLLPSATRPLSAVTPWHYKLDYTFDGGASGDNPSQVTFDAHGNMWGSASSGGVDGNGLVFEMTPSNGDWSENVIYNFLGGSDGAAPQGVAFDPSGNIFGVTLGGGNQGCYENLGCGTVYELSPSGSSWTKTTLHVFQEDTDGAYPGPLVRDTAGNLYGVTGVGSSNGGTIWELSPSAGGWVFRVLFNLPGLPNTISDTFPLVLDDSGALYGVNNYIGANNLGSTFKLVSSSGSWIYTDLHDFGSLPNQQDGCFPFGPVALDAAGNVYGTTQQCGNGEGVIYEITR